MKIVTWNIRGIDNPQKEKKKLKKEYSEDKPGHCVPSRNQMHDHSTAGNKQENLERE